MVGSTQGRLTLNTQESHRAATKAAPEAACTPPSLPPIYFQAGCNKRYDPVLSSPPREPCVWRSLTEVAEGYLHRLPSNLHQEFPCTLNSVAFWPFGQQSSLGQTGTEEFLKLLSAFHAFTILFCASKWGIWKSRTAFGFETRGLFRLCFYGNRYWKRKYIEF